MEEGPMESRRTLLLVVTTKLLLLLPPPLLLLLLLLPPPPPLCLDASIGTGSQLAHLQGNLLCSTRLALPEPISVHASPPSVEAYTPTPNAPAYTTPSISCTNT
jgi:hypothetical protein